MNIVDTHCHAGPNWYEPVESLLHQMNVNGVEKAALTQHWGAYDNTYLLECAERFPGRFRVVVLMDPEQPDLASTLETWAMKGAAGVRLGCDVRSPGADPLAVWRKAAELGLVVSARGPLSDYASDDFRNLIAELPGLSIIIEHLAGLGPGAQPPYAAFKKALELSSYANTYLKVGGLGEICVRPSALQPHFAFDYVPPLIEMALNAFGPRRMMWGSDYPPVSNREGYRNSLQGILEHPALRNQEDREWVMGKTALSVFKFQ